VFNLAQTVSINKIFGDSIKDDDVLKALESFIDVYRQRKQKNLNPSIPLSLFANRKLGSLEIIVKYMKENLSMDYYQIAELIKRDQRTIWGTHHNAAVKHKKEFAFKNEEHMIPCSIFSDRSMGPLEALVVYLKDEVGLSFRKISALLNRDYSTIWTSYKNGKKSSQ
jgi:hypothetical protein